MQQAPHAGLRAVRRGDVLAQDGRHGVVWRVNDPTTVIVFPIDRTNAPRHRGDVMLHDMADMISIGCAGQRARIRAGFPVIWHVGGNVFLAGTAPPLLMVRLKAALIRAADALRIEAMFGL